MVVKLYFTDGSVVVRSFSDEELFNHNILNTDKITEYLENSSNNYRPIDSWFFKEKGLENYGSQIVTIDLRDYFKKYNSFLNKNIDGKIINKFEFFSEDSYEYGISLLGEDGLYFRDIFVEYEIDHYASWKNREK